MFSIYMVNELAKIRDVDKCEGELNEVVNFSVSLISSSFVPASKK